MNHFISLIEINVLNASPFYSCFFLLTIPNINKTTANSVKNTLHLSMPLTEFLNCLYLCLIIIFEKKITAVSETPFCSSFQPLPCPGVTVRQGLHPFVSFHFLLLLAQSRGGIVGALAALWEHEVTLTTEAIYKGWWSRKRVGAHHPCISTEPHTSPGFWPLEFTIL